ncbi:methyltransferase domain-containing protein [Corynebacterium sp. ES2794-CONJ1]|uniref:methyltransferase domain-containing protein n=1 Tax=unclassified Corynebacterium TaxID=2624378 RepID=UPI002167FF6D|nr:MULTISPECIES: methyltransferase domain-containing protein [unclassified Corynebacterium]MCS4489876.1 methyltransferase domain-containing protein [Corynebacterium sp. ES2775-CONJ]MCS4491760.1 methyltransferase domain-containing protein [Corynebacterium sp. ES2715-CONJ3]MCS4531865.1 methyltransferase domain-containing protein [Corynebacterium sp. ES2730-CONJ]MCU9519262.1 methyltransferase domain-containing protein [Corynebacterium sp. ES2794-CONJ1]
MLSHIVDVLADPEDGTRLFLSENGRYLSSESGHTYDVAKQGYVSLVGGSGLRHHGDDLAMVRARESFLALGHFAPFVETVSTGIDEALSGVEAREPVILEIGAGTGYYLSHILDSIPDSRGVGLDISTPAAKALAKSHPRVGAVVADAWKTLPIRPQSIDAIAVVFAPRNPQEFSRVLKTNGEVVILSPNPNHLQELREPLGILRVEKDKIHRMLEQSAKYFDVADEGHEVEFSMRLDQECIAAQIGMSPSARHIPPADLEARISSLDPVMMVTASATITRLRKIQP